MALVCAVAIGDMMLIDKILIGGKLAGLTNLALAVVAVVSARQAKTDGDRFPRLRITDLMVAIFFAAVVLWWFWGPPVIG